MNFVKELPGDNVENEIVPADSRRYTVRAHNEIRQNDRAENLPLTYAPSDQARFIEFNVLGVDITHVINVFNNTNIVFGERNKTAINRRAALLPFGRDRVRRRVACLRFSPRDDKERIFIALANNETRRSRFCRRRRRRVLNGRNQRTALLRFFDS